MSLLDKPSANDIDEQNNNVISANTLNMNPPKAVINRFYSKMDDNPEGTEY